MREAREYDLRLKDRTLAQIRIEDDELGSATARAVWADAEAARLMPFGLELTDEGIWRWLEGRALPYNRRYSEEICRSLGFDINDTEAIYRAGLGLSLNDCYWLPPHDSPLRFDDVTPYENGFSVALSQIALEGSSRAPSHGLTPELTTDGTLPKAWKIEPDGTRALYKGATHGYKPGEPMSEALASAIADSMGIDHVAYRLRTIDGRTYSACDNFTTTDVSYVPYALAVNGHRKLSDALAFAWLLGDEEFEKLCDMLVLDCVICNNDRHFANFGFLRVNDTGNLVGMAPVFDNGRGLFPNVAEAELADLNRESHLIRPAFGDTSFEELCTHVMGVRQRDALAKLSLDGFEAPSGTDARGEIVREFVSKRASDLSRLPMVDQDAFMTAVRAHALRITGCEQGEWQPSHREIRSFGHDSSSRAPSFSLASVENRRRKR